MTARAFALPLVTVAVAALAPRAVTAQVASGHLSHSARVSPAPLTVSWSMPMNHVTRRVPSWSATDIGLAGGFLALLWVDAAQTRSIARQGWKGFYEVNPILGRQPSVGQINTYTAAAAVATLGVAAILPQRARRWFLAGAVAVEASTVIYMTTSVGIPLTIR